MTWSEIKKELAKLEKKELVMFIGHLHKLGKDNKKFLEAYFASEQDVLEMYLDEVDSALYPHFLYGGNVNIPRAKRAVSNYKKAKNSTQEGLAELMVFYVERATEHALDLGGMGEGFYNAVLTMYDTACKHLVGMWKQGADITDWRERLANLVPVTKGIGWGFHDELGYTYKHYFM